MVKLYVRLEKDHINQGIHPAIQVEKDLGNHSFPAYCLLMVREGFTYTRPSWPEGKVAYIPGSRIHSIHIFAPKGEGH